MPRGQTPKCVNQVTRWEGTVNLSREAHAGIERKTDVREWVCPFLFEALRTVEQASKHLLFRLEQRIGVRCPVCRCHV